jgi:AbrB family looped-hinge helix DNA binding protein
MQPLTPSARSLTFKCKIFAELAMRITSKGQVTIPVDIREKAGLLPGTEVDFELDGEGVRILRATAPKGETRGQRAVRRLWGSATIKMSTDEIMALTRGEE